MNRQPEKPTSRQRFEEWLTESDYEWGRMWWGAAIGVAISIVGQLMGATAWLWLTVPFLAVFAGLPFGSNGP